MGLSPIVSAKTSKQEEYQLYQLREMLIKEQMDLSFLDKERGEQLLQLLYFQRDNQLFYASFPYYLMGIYFYFKEWPTLQDELKALTNYLKALQLLKEVQEEILSFFGEGG